jgi:aminoglycoside phosphotransferase (APT) family kinase protein
MTESGAPAVGSATPVPPSDPGVLDVGVIAAYLDAEHLGEGPVEAVRIGEGQSNVTFRLRRGSRSFVLRRGPRPPFPPSAHDMVREARILRALGGSGYPVPRVLSVCTTDEVIGVPFYVMEHLDGDVVTDVLPERFRSAEGRRQFVFSAVDALVQLHALPLEGDLAAIGRPDGYLSRQVERFHALAHRDPVRDLSDLDPVGTWLQQNLPRESGSSIVHGDFRLGNLMFARDDAPRVQAVLDWEMATAGDPLADLGYLVATYAQSDSPPTVMELTPVTRGAGFPTRNEIIARYGERSGRATTDLDWYQALALWKSAIFCEAIYARWLRGERPDDHSFGPALEQGVPDLLRAARRLIDR